MTKKTKKKTNIKGTTEKPRLSVFRSSKHIFAQIIDDSIGSTLAEASSLKLESGKKVDTAKQVGKLIAERAKEKKITKIVFDRGRYVYKRNSRVAALADSARENGLSF